MSTYIDGIGASENIDSSGERISIAGMDISSLALDGVFNYEHDQAKTNQGESLSIKVPSNVVGKVLKAKKIFSEKDCSDERELYYWQKALTPYVYVMGELFDDYKESAKDVAGMFRYDADKKDQQERNVMNFSIEGAKIDKQGIDIVKSIARKVTITVHPCNKAAIAEMVPGKQEIKNDIDSLFKTETSVEIELFKAEDMNKFMDDIKKSANLKLVPPQQDARGSHMGKTKSGKSVFTHERIHNYAGFSSEDHRDAAAHHYNALKSSADPKMAQHHDGKMRIHMQAASSAERREGRFATGQAKAASRASEIGKQANKMIPGFDRGGAVKKAETAGSALSAPSQKTGGAALAKESLDKTIHKAARTKDELNRGGIRGFPGKYMSAKNPRIKSTMGESNTGMHIRAGEQEKAKRVATRQLKKLKAQPKPNLTKSEYWLDRAEKEFASWDKKEDFVKFMSERMPNLTKTEIEVFGKTMALKKSLENEAKLTEMTKSLTEDKKKKS